MFVGRVVALARRTGSTGVQWHHRASMHVAPTELAMTKTLFHRVFVVLISLNDFIFLTTLLLFLFPIVLHQFLSSFFPFPYRCFPLYHFCFHLFLLIPFASSLYFFNFRLLFDVSSIFVFRSVYVYTAFTLLVPFYSYNTLLSFS
jgi:hypothetical protein